MTSPIRTQRHDDVLVVISDNPPVNALGQAVRAGLKDAIDEAIGDDAVKAVVIRCDGRTFFAGADITEFGKPPVGPSLPETLDAMEASDKILRILSLVPQVMCRVWFWKGGGVVSCHAVLRGIESGGLVGCQRGRRSRLSPLPPPYDILSQLTARGGDNRT